MRFHKKKKMSRRKKASLVFGFSVLFLFVIFFTYKKHTVNQIYVEGNIYYTEEEIKALVFEEGEVANTIFLSIKYGNDAILDIPFIEQMEVQIEWPDTVHIIVYEKILAGYVSYLGESLYFDSDGIVVEAPNDFQEKIPHITGLHFSHMNLYDELQVEEEGVFFMILDITKILQKYDLYPTEIYFASKEEVVLIFDDVRIRIGESVYLDEKFSSIKEILPNIEGLSGEISLEKYDGSKQTITFHED